MTDREKDIILSIDNLTADCINYLESNYSVIPNIGLFNMDLIVFAFLMDRLLTERRFKDHRMQKFLNFFEKHFLAIKCKTPRKTTVYSLENEEIDWKNLVAYLNFKEMNENEKSHYFIRTLSNISTDLDKFIESTKNYSESSKIHYPYLALVNVYVDPLFCYKTPIKDYNQEIGFLSYEIKSSNIHLANFPITLFKMWHDVFSTYLDDDSMLLNSIELNFS